MGEVVITGLDDAAQERCIQHVLRDQVRFPPTADGRPVVVSFKVTRSAKAAPPSEGDADAVDLGTVGGTREYGLGCRGGGPCGGRGGGGTVGSGSYGTIGHGTGTTGSDRPFGKPSKPRAAPPPPAAPTPPTP